MRKILFAVSLFSALNVYSQGYTYDSVNELIQIYNPLGLYGGGVSFYDYNKDGFDDLTFCINNDSIIFYRNLGGNSFLRQELIPNTLDAKQPTWVDYDNDGDADLMISRRGNGLKLYRNDGQFIYTDVTADLDIPMALNAASYGCSWADYDRDGFLDCYVCNYNWMDGTTNWLFHNNGDGTFNEVASTVGVSNGSLPSFQAVWVDFDFDSWPDLYVVNDKHTGNAMYRNTGGNFSNASVATGSNVFADSMSNSISDYDNDGDFDIYIANDTESNILLKNENGVFSDAAEEAGVGVNALCWGSLWVDYDNDSFDDLHVSTTSPGINSNQNFFFVNLGDGTFEQQNSLGLNADTYNSYSSAKGDWNNDGFPDMIITNTFASTAALYTNQGFGKKWIKYGLQGTVSNRDAVGTLIETYVGGNRYIRYTMCGENYIAQDSQYEIVGIGNGLAVDSVVLSWPSGFVEKHYNVQALIKHEFVEGETLTAEISVIGSETICGDNSVTLDAGQWYSYLWSTGQTTAAIVAAEAGVYSVTVANEFGVGLTVSRTILEVQVPQINADIEHLSCTGETDGTIQLNIVGEDQIVLVDWNSENVGTEITNLSAGNYTFNVLTEFGCQVALDLEVTEPDDITYSIETALVACFGAETGTATIATAGGTGEIEQNWNGLDPLALPANNYSVQLTDENGCIEIVEFEIEQMDVIAAMVNLDNILCFGESGPIQLFVSGGMEPYQVNWGQFSPDELFAGEYNIVITDAFLCEINQTITVLENPELAASFNIFNANNGNNGSVQIVVSGGLSPYSYNWSSGAQTSVASALGQGTYICTVTDDAGCVVNFEVSVIDVSVEDLLDENFIEVFPIPFKNTLNIQVKNQGIIEIRDMKGSLVWNGIIKNSETIDTSTWSAGAYLINQSIRIVKFE
ncbi:MAG: FG-GAP-like repeat-containing protein [Flavobacteriales bacterium]|nr:FG-GAP-like repeat-containing protein [Flavobacteriales bacterium]